MKIRINYAKSMQAACKLTVIVVLSLFLCACTGKEKEEVSLEQLLDTSQAVLEESPKEIVMEASDLYIHVCGEVKNPGVYRLDGNSRINDAIAMAGGFTEEAYQLDWNLAGKLEDGMQILVLSMEEAEERNEQQLFLMEQQAEQAAGLVNINEASEEQLCTLSGVGGSKAKSIIQYRETNGDFQCIEDIMKVTGIKDSLFQKIKDEITVGIKK